MNTDTETRWFELLTDSVAHYVTDTSSEVYAMRADAPYFLRVTEDDGTYVLTQLTNDRAELIGGDVRLSRVPDAVVAATIEALLS